MIIITPDIIPELQIMISPGLYDYRGIQYVDNSFKVGRFEGTYGLYSPTFNVNDEFSDIAGTGQKLSFVGRLGTFRGEWQFVIEDISCVNPGW